ncbi:hypothetical protein [Komagataeibacter xylinus]|uniref:hypothetical protein n=1 Tax=Komagataeibacter xylinus TaxID=28448 RepID=UPI0013310951|nr:hypothetical protein [Komagataeibacter xylinus]
MSTQALVMADPFEYWLWKSGWLIPLELFGGALFLCWFLFVAVSIMRVRRRIMRG